MVPVTEIPATQGTAERRGSRLPQEVRSGMVQHYESPSSYLLRGAGTSEVLEEHQHTEAAIGGR